MALSQDTAQTQTRAFQGNRLIFLIFFRNYNEDRVAIILNIMKPKSKETRSTCLEKNLQGHKSSTGRQQRCKREQSRRCSRVRNSPRKRWLLFQAVRHTPPWPCLNLEQHCHCSDSNFPSKCCKLCDTCKIDVRCCDSQMEMRCCDLHYIYANWYLHYI